MLHWIPKLIDGGSGSEMTEDGQEKLEAVANHFGAVFIQGPLLNEELKPTAKSENRQPTVHFGQDDVLKAFSALETQKSTVLDEVHLKILGQIAQ